MPGGARYAKTAHEPCHATWVGFSDLSLFGEEVIAENFGRVCGIDQTLLGGLVFARTAWRSSSFARTATEGTAIGAIYAADGRDASSGGAPISVISAARKGGSIIASASTGR